MITSLNNCYNGLHSLSHINVLMLGFIFGMLLAVIVAIMVQVLDI